MYVILHLVSPPTSNNSALKLLYNREGGMHLDRSHTSNIPSGSYSKTRIRKDLLSMSSCSAPVDPSEIEPPL